MNLGSIFLNSCLSQFSELFKNIVRISSKVPQMCGCLEKLSSQDKNELAAFKGSRSCCRWYILLWGVGTCLVLSPRPAPDAPGQAGFCRQLRTPIPLAGRESRGVSANTEPGILACDKSLFNCLKEEIHYCSLYVRIIVKFC